MRYVLCYTPRSGSTLLTEALRGTGVAGRPRECLGDEAFRRFAEANPKGTPAQYLAGVLRQSETPNGVSAVRVHWHAWQALPGRLGLPDLAALHQYLGSPRYVLSTRADKDAQAVSCAIARQTGVWWVWADRPAKVPAKVPEFDEKEIARSKDAAAEMEADWRAFFASVKAEPVEVVYEDLDADYDATVKRVVAELGIGGTVTVPEAKLTKQADAANADWLRQFQAADVAPGPRPSPKA